jgi:hypothetical protein
MSTLARREVGKSDTITSMGESIGMRERHFNGAARTGRPPIGASKGPQFLEELKEGALFIVDAVRIGLRISPLGRGL